MTLELGEDLDRGVKRMAAAHHVSEDFLTREAVRKFVEDREDYQAGIQTLSAMKYTISLEELGRRSDVAG